MNRDYKIALILPYYGKFPNYFNLWLCSAGKNPNYDFFIFADSFIDSHFVPQNVHVINMSFDSIKFRIANILPYQFKLKKPYKLCDYRPLFGVIFSDYLENYHFWGHCDPDIIWGNLSKFITFEILSSYDRIYTSGHLSIYRNNIKFNYSSLARSSLSLITSRHIFTTDYSAHFDEGPLLKELQVQAGMRIYDVVDCADVLYNRKPFFIKLEDSIMNVSCFEYYNGHIWGYLSDSSHRNEYAYVHLQKRSMKLSIFSEHFFIIPNSFTDDSEQLKDFSKFLMIDLEYEKIERRKLFRRRLTNIRQGALVFRFLGFLTKFRKIITFQNLRQ